MTTPTDPKPKQSGGANEESSEALRRAAEEYGDSARQKVSDDRRDDPEYTGPGYRRYAIDAFLAGAAWQAERKPSGGMGANISSMEAAEEHDLRNTRKRLSAANAELSALRSEVTRLQGERDGLIHDQNPDYSVRPRIQHENDKELYVLQQDALVRLRAELTATVFWFQQGELKRKNLTAALDAAVEGLKEAREGFFGDECFEDHLAAVDDALTRIAALRKGEPG